MSKADDTRRQVEVLTRDVNTKQHKNLVKKRAIDTYNSEKQVGDTRQSLAKVFVYSFFGLMTAILLLVPLYNYWIANEANDPSLVINLEDLLLTYSSIVGPMLGFVVGYYFKSKAD